MIFDNDRLMTMKRIQLTTFLLCTAMLLTGCSSVMMPGSPGASLLDQLPNAGILSSSNAAHDESLEINFGMARVAERNDRVDQAVKAYHEILSKYPKHSATLHRMGVIAARQGRMDEAMNYFSQAAELEEPSAELLSDIGYAQYLANDYDTAAATLQKAAYLSPDDERVVNNLAIVFGMQKKYSDSLDLFRQTGSEAESLAGVAFTQSQTGQLDQAKSTYHRSLEIDSSLEVAANGLMELERHARSAEDDRGSLTSNQVATRAEVRNFPPADSERTRKPLLADSADVGNREPGVLRSLATAIHERSGLKKSSESESKLAKPPVIPLAELEGSAAMSPRLSGNQTPHGTRPGTVSESSAAGSTARIVMTDSIAVPVAVRSETPETYSGDGDGKQAALSGPSSRRAVEASRSLKSSQVRQASYEQTLEAAALR